MTKPNNNIKIKKNQFHDQNVHSQKKWLNLTETVLMTGRIGIELNFLIL